MGVGAGLYMYVVVVQKFTFAISSPDEFLLVMPPVKLLLDSCVGITPICPYIVKPQDRVCIKYIAIF